MNKVEFSLAVWCTSLFAAILPAQAHASGLGKPREYLVYVGTYTNETKSKGIYAYRFNPASGELTELGLQAESVSPSFLAADRRGRFLYAVNEIDDYQGKKAGAVSAFALDAKSGKLKFLNMVSSGGDGPCHLMVDNTGKMLIVANYGGGSVASFPIGSDGRLGEAASFDQHKAESNSDAKPRQQPHAHCANVSPNNKFVMVNDLGLDEVFVYRLDPSKASITPNDPAVAKLAAGAGPRHFAFHPNNRFAYTINELQSTVTAFDYQSGRGALSQIQTISTLPPDFKGENSTAEMFIHPNGRFLYGSNRGHNSIAVFSIDGGTGKLSLVEHVSTQGDTPRGFALDPTGRFLFAANQKSDNMVIFRIDRTTGKLTPTGKSVTIGAPVSVLFVAAGTK